MAISRIKIGNTTHVINAYHASSADSASYDSDANFIRETYLPVWGGTLTGPLYFAGDSRSVQDRLNALETGICLKKGTQITMADGTTKNIEDVKYGDVVRGYDIENNAYVNVKSYGSVHTGIANKWNVFTFEDGSMLEIYSNHQLYSHTEKYMKHSHSWKCGEYGISEKLEPLQLAVVRTIGDPEFTERYALYTENSTYFANGIVSGHHPWSRMKVYSAGVSSFTKNITEEELEFFKATAEVFKRSVRKSIDQREFMKEAAPYYAKINIADQEIKKRKKLLNTTDYKTIKHSQGKLSEEEFSVVCVDCQSVRDEIAEQENICANNTAKVNELKSKYNIGKADSLKERFDMAYAIDMEHVRNNGLN